MLKACSLSELAPGEALDGGIKITGSMGAPNLPSGLTVDGHFTADTSN